MFKNQMKLKLSLTFEHGHVLKSGNTYGTFSYPLKYKVGRVDKELFYIAQVLRLTGVQFT